MAQYIGGAFATVYGKQTMDEPFDSSAFTKSLGMAEVLAKETQDLLDVPDAAHREDAAQAILRTRLDFSVDLELTVASLGRAADVLARVGMAGVPSPIHLGRLLAMWGSYFGEALIHDYGGRWRLDPKQGNVVLLPRDPLPPVKVNPYGVVEDMIRTRDRTRLARWLAAVQRARQSAEFQLPPVE